MKKILVSIVNYNSFHHIEELINSLKWVDISLIDVCVVDNQSPYDDFDHMKKYCENLNIYIFQAPKNGWFAYGNNRVVQYMKDIWKEYEYIYLINPDMLIKEKNFFNDIYKKAKDTQAHILWPMICEYKNPNIIHFAGWFLKWPMLFPTKLWRWKKDLGQFCDIECDYINGSAMLVKYTLWKRFWGMNENYFLYFEETDFCWKAKKLWYTILCTTNIRIYDKISWSVWRMSNLYIKQMLWNYKKFADIYIYWAYKLIWRLFYLFVWCPFFYLNKIKNIYDK